MIKKELKVDRKRKTKASKCNQSNQIESGRNESQRQKRSGFAPLTFGVPAGGALALALCQEAPGVAASEIRRSFVVSVVGS